MYSSKKYPKLKGNSLKVNTFWNMLGNIVQSLSQWALIVVLAKITNAEMVGIFSLGLALTAPLVLLMRFNLRISVASDINNEYQFSEYFLFRLYTSIIFFISMIIVANLYPSDLYTKAVVLCLSLGKVFESISDILHADWQKKERFDFIGKAKVLKSILSTAMFIFVILLFENLLLATISLSAMWFLILIFYEFKIFNKYNTLSLGINKKKLLYLLKLTFPLGLAQLISSLNANIPRYIVEYFHGIELLGIYSALIYIIVAGTNFMIAFSNVLVTRLAYFYNNKKNKKFVKLLLYPSIVIIIGGLLGAWIIYYHGDILLETIYSKEYSFFSYVFTLMIFMAIISYLNIFLDAGIASTRNFKVLPIINFISMTFTIAFGLILIREFAINGAVFTLIIAEFIQLIIRLLVLNSILRKNKKEG